MITSPLKAIKDKCLDCCCYNRSEVKACTVSDCALFPFRFGKNPFRAKKELSEEQRKAASERLKNIRRNSK